MYGPLFVELAMTISDQSWARLGEINKACQGRHRCEDLEPGTSETCCPPALRKEYVPVSVAFGGQTVSAYARHKGNPRDWCEDCPYQFVIRFNKPNKKARFLGLRRLNLEGERHGALVRNNAAMWVMRRMGIAAPRTNWLKLTLNGAAYAIYENIEAVDKEFLTNHFADANANLYKHLLTSELKTNEKTGDTTALTALHDLFEESDKVLFAKLGGVANVRQWVKLAAAEATLPASDNFWTSNYNLYIYDDPHSGWTIIPWDLDDVMYDKANWDASLVDGQVELGDWWARMLHNPTWWAWFLQDVKHTLNTAYKDLPAQIDIWCCGLRDEVAALSDSPVAQFSSRASFDSSCRELKAHITCRIKYLNDVLAGGSGAVECDPTAMAKSGAMALDCK